MMMFSQDAERSDLRIRAVFCWLALTAAIRPVLSAPTMLNYAIDTFARPPGSARDVPTLSPAYLEYSTAHIDSLLQDMSAQAQSTVGTSLDGAIPLQKRAAAASCLNSSATDVDINALLYYGGAGTTVYFCPNAAITLQNPIFFTAANQVLRTLNPKSQNARALLSVGGTNQSVAIYGGCDQCSGIQIVDLQVYGARDTLGRLFDGLALIEVGGMSSGQLVQNVKAWEPRGWSTLHAMEGPNLACSGMRILRNQIGPAGNAPNDGSPFRRKRQTVSTTYGPGEWADGISLACKNTEVAYNDIVDSTDGSIVIFGATGSNVHDNTITQNSRRGLGGINMVDWAPFGGSYEGTIVQNNKIVSNTEMIKLGIAIGGMSWGGDNRTEARTFAGTVQGNTFSSGRSGYFYHAITVAGHNNSVVQGNKATAAKFGGQPSYVCIPSVQPPPPQDFVYDQWTTTGASLQAGFASYPLAFLICVGPGPIVQGGASVKRSPAQRIAATVSSTTTTSSAEASSSETSDAQSPSSTSAAVSGSRVGSPAKVANDPAQHRPPSVYSTAMPPKTTPAIPPGMVNPFVLRAAAAAAGRSSSH